MDGYPHRDWVPIGPRERTFVVSEQALEIWEELEKTVSVVGAARRLLVTGAKVDLAALEGRVRYVCRSVEGLDRIESRTMVPVMEALIDDLDHLADAMREYHAPLADRLEALDPPGFR